MSKRAEEAKRLRDLGLTYQQVGDRLGVSVGWARSLVSQGKVHLMFHGQTPRCFDELRQQTCSALLAAGYKSREEVLADVDVLYKHRGIGNATVKEIMTWLKIDPEIQEIKTVFDFIRWLGSKSDMINARIILEPEINPKMVVITLATTSPNAEQCTYYTGLPDPLFMGKMMSVEYDKFGSIPPELLRALAMAVEKKICSENIQA